MTTLVSLLDGPGVGVGDREAAVEEEEDVDDVTRGLVEEEEERNVVGERRGKMVRLIDWKDAK